MKRVCQNAKRLLFVVVSFLLLGYANAQVTVTGTVMDGTLNEPMIGANVIEKGTTNGTVTDFDGNYTLTVSSANAEIEFSYIGYIPQTMKVGEQRSISVTLVENVKELTEVVKIGYGVSKKEDVTSAITSLKEEDIKGRPVLGVDQALQGKAAGVQVQTNSGTPGGEIKINIRGIASLENSDPLYIVDGVPQGGIMGLNTSDIASISILKDASACAIYGARGANGVIIITTKSGREGTGKIQDNVMVDFSSYMGVQKAWNTVDVMNASEYIDYYNKRAGDTIYTIKDGKIYDVNDNVYNEDANGTDWQDQLYRSAIIQNYQLSVSGASEKSSFAASIGWFDQEGIVKTTDFQRLTARMRGDHIVSKRIRIGESIGFHNYDQSRVDQGGMWSNVLTNALVMSPISPIKDSLRITERNPEGYVSDIGRNTNFLLNEFYDKTNNYGLGGNFYVEIDLLKGLSFKTQVSKGIWAEKRDKYNNDFEITSDLQALRKLEEQMSGGNNTNWTNSLSYTKTLYAKKDDGSRDSSKLRHSFNAVVATEKYHTYEERYSIFSFNLYSDQENLRYPWLSQTDSTYVEADPNWQGVNEYTLASYLGRLEYNFLNKYNVNISFRRDGSSKFGSDKKWEYFPSFGGAWKIHKENFFKNSEALRFVNAMKFRFGWGRIGNSAAAGSYGWASLMDTENYAYNFGGSQVVGASTVTPQNKFVQWEASETYNVGLDFEFLRSKILFSVDYFNKQTTDMLVKEPLPATAGTGTDPITNHGKMENKGWELFLSYKKQEGAFHYSVNGNIAFIDNQITYMGGTEASPNTQQAGYVGPSGQYVVLNAENQDVGAFYGFYVDPDDKYYTSWSDVNSSPKSSKSDVAPGDLKYVDINGDGKITDDDMTYIGSPLADFTYGLSLQADYKGFDFNCSFSGSQGNDIFDAVTYWLEGDKEGFNQSASKLEAWTEENTDALTPKSSTNNKNYDYSSSHYVKDGSYLRMKDITLGYTIPEKITSKVKIQRLRIYIQAQNLLTFTGYDGADPEVGNNPDSGYDSKGAKGFELGVDRGTYPQPRTWLFGLNLSF